MKTNKVLKRSLILGFTVLTLSPTVHASNETCPVPFAFEPGRPMSYDIVEKVGDMELQLRVNPHVTEEKVALADISYKDLVDITSTVTSTRDMMHTKALSILNPNFGVSADISTKLQTLTVTAFEMVTKKSETEVSLRQEAYDPVKDPLAVLQGFRYKLDNLTEKLSGMGNKLTKPTLFARLGNLPLVGNALMKMDAKSKRAYVDSVLKFNDEVSQQAVDLAKAADLLRVEISELELADIQLSDRIMQMNMLEKKIHESLPQLDSFTQDRLRKVAFPLMAQIKNEQLGILVAIRANIQTFETTAEILPELSNLTGRILQVTVPTIAALTRAGVISDETKRIANSISGLKKSNDKAINSLGKSLENMYSSYMTAATTSVVGEKTVEDLAAKLQKIRSGVEQSDVAITEKLGQANVALNKQLQLASEIIPLEGVTAREQGLLSQITRLIKR